MTRFARMQGVGGWTTAAASLLLAGICAASPSAPAVKLKPVEWARAFGRPEPFVQTERLYAFSASPPANIVVGLATGPAEAQSTRIVVAEPSGRNARRIPGAINGWIESVQPSPDGTKLACVSKPSHSYPVTAGARLSVLDVRTGASTLISTSDAWAPEWSADGRSLFFWQRAGGMEAQWQPFCAEPAAKGAGPKAASDLMGEEPGVFSRNARHAAALGEGVATVEDLLTRRRTSYELPVALSEGKVLWSWDSERLILHGAVRGALHWARYGSYVINRSTRSVDSLLAQLGLEDPTGSDGLRHVAAAAWMPGKGHRLLAAVETWRKDEGRLGAKLVERRWLIRDLDAKTTVAVDGIRTESAFPLAGELHPLQFSPDGRYLRVNRRLYAVVPPNSKARPQNRATPSPSFRLRYHYTAERTYEEIVVDGTTLRFTYYKPAGDARAGTGANGNELPQLSVARPEWTGADLTTETVSLSAAELRELKQLIRTSGFLRLTTRRPPGRSYPHTIWLKMNATEKRVEHHSRPGSGPMPRALEKVQKRMFQLVNRKCQFKIEH